MRRTISAAAGLGAAVLLAAPALSGAAAGTGEGVTPAQQQALDLGIQAAPKGGATSLAKGAVTPNPWLANLPDVTDADYFTWNTSMREAAVQRAASAKLATNRRLAAATLRHRGRQEPARQDPG